MMTNLGPGTVLMACRVPDGLKNYLALTYELSGTFETAPVVDCGLVEKIDDIENGKQIVMQGGYKDLGHIEDFQAAVRLLKAKIEGGEEVPPVEEAEEEKTDEKPVNAAPVEKPAEAETEAKDEGEGEGA